MSNTEALAGQMPTEEPVRLSLEEIVSRFLQVAVLHPDKPPRTQRAERDNSMIILGFNQAQEALRTVLRERGESEAVRAIGDMRADGQQQPIDGPSGRKMWVVG